MTNLFKGVPVLGKALAPVRLLKEASERAFVTNLNVLRASVFDGFLERHPNATQEEKKIWAAFVNSSTGRGDLGRLNKVANELSILFYAPRFAWSRIQAPAQVLRPGISNRVRGEIAISLVAYFGTGMTILALAKMAGAETEDDPEDSDWGKIVYTDTRIDIWGGVQQPMRLVAQFGLQGGELAGFAERESSESLWSIGLRFLSYKASPVVNLPISILEGKNIIGQERTLIETAIEAYSPFILQETIDVWENTQDIGKTAAAALLVGTGVGVSEQPKRKSKKKTSKF